MSITQISVYNLLEMFVELKYTQNLTLIRRHSIVILCDQNIISLAKSSIRAFLNGCNALAQHGMESIRSVEAIISLNDSNCPVFENLGRK